MIEQFPALTPENQQVVIEAAEFLRDNPGSSKLFTSFLKALDERDRDTLTIWENWRASHETNKG